MANLLKANSAFFLLLISFSVAGQDSILVDTRIDNMRYWNKLIQNNVIEGNPEVEIPRAIYTGSQLISRSSTSVDSPDIALSDSISLTENTIFVDPDDNNIVANSNNASDPFQNGIFGTNFLISEDNGATWGGEVECTSGSNGNYGDPAIVMDSNGKKYVGYINTDGGQSIDQSENGTVWQSNLVSQNSESMLDKNHLWIDNSPVSSHHGNIYNAWTWFGGANDTQIGLSRSTDGGITWSTPLDISSNVNALEHNQGVNIQTGPNGEVYAVWAIYDFWNFIDNGYEEALGFAKSTDGGQTFAPATRIVENIKGIRQGITKNMRVNSYPSMATDITGRSTDGNIYITWANYGTPGENSGSNVSIYFIRSADEGATWSAPVRVNQGPLSEGKEAYFPWITCDPETGTLCVIYYDDRNVSSTQVETYVSISYDEGTTWEDMQISDVAFTPTPIVGVAPGYMGDYLGIASRRGKVYPVWPDNRTGLHLSYISPFETLNLEKPINLLVDLNDDSGETGLTWEFPYEVDIEHFNVYRDGNQVGTTTELEFIDNLPDFGMYNYAVSAQYDTIESAVTRQTIQWGSAMASATPAALELTLNTNETGQLPLTISNIGELDMHYKIFTAIDPETVVQSTLSYCTASGGGDEYISHVSFREIDNASGSDGYTGYSDQIASVDIGNTYDITVVNGSPASTDDLGVWVDWNQDGDFNDENENPVCEVSSFGMGTYPIAVPIDAKGGATTMRIRVKYSGANCGEPCGSTNYGEVEDYSINVNSWFLLNHDDQIDTISPGSDRNFEANFNSEGLMDGVYTANILVYSNEVDNPELIIPVQLTVNSIVGLGNPANNLKWNVYPNPSKGDVLLEGFSQVRQEVDVHVYNNLGVNVLTKRVSVYQKFNIAFDLSKFSDGVYMLHLNGAHTYHTKKVVLLR